MPTIINHPPVWVAPTDANKTKEAVAVKKAKYKFVKAGKNGLLVELIIDASGSMAASKYQTRIGINEFLNEQAKNDKAYVTLRTFATPMGNERHVTHFRHIKSTEAPRITDEDYVTAGNTPLYDAVGMAITEINNFLKDMPQKERPGILVNIVTDGIDNRSHRYTKQQVREMINAATDSNWSFTFIGTNINAEAYGHEMGIMAQNTMNYTAANTAGVMRAASASANRYSKAISTSSFNSRDYAGSGAMFTHEERVDVLGTPVGINPHRDHSLAQIMHKDEFGKLMRKEPPIHNEDLMNPRLMSKDDVTKLMTTTICYPNTNQTISTSTTDTGYLKTSISDFTKKKND